ncbi:Pkinase-domain-containing protein [Laetiporus sulphureus 93-53]|uniref:Pkinase-domain-containing protein n=1 Tax=Laetiporus sulphureus 93-53 TaxID=1314785 RepID=A0A165E8U6_9APHY|nr:Pkinase-domain-containing protein [Laetiporus sulphureus 93-53]KZT06485.1 Pkinase-domain-containing protein [Laetiporus sulphureus 93-53]
MVQFSAILPDFTGEIVRSAVFHLRLTEKLGSGAYGVVYSALDLNSPSERPTTYAVKCLLRHTEDSEYRRYQRREVLLHRKASAHPHVIKIHQVIEDEHYIFVVLNFCQGGDLFSAIAERKVFEGNDALVKKAFLQLIDAVHACHDVGISHRDLKTENILCSEDGEEIFLSDFGLATRSKVSMSHGCGSSYYMSPECIGDDTEHQPFLNPVSDIWSLGIILINMITGHNPWHIASMDNDNGFARYTREGNTYLLRNLPISPAVADILGRILAPAEYRITLRELRKAILAVDTFFRDPDVKVTVGSVSAPASLFSLSTRPISCSTCSSGFVHILPLPSDFAPRSSRPDDDGVGPLLDIPSPVRAGRTDSTMVHVPSLVPSLSSGSSRSESASPITPEHLAIVLSTSIPELQLDMPQLSDPVSSFASVAAENGAAVSWSSLAMKKRKLPRSWQRIKGAVQRIRVMV